jgi:nitrous oxidase accessory protein NosD
VLENEAKATFRHCNIYVSEDEASSSGIVLHNRAELVFLESTISGFREYGIEARDESSAIEEGNHFEGMGIAFIGNVSPPIHLTEAAEQFSEVAYPDPRYLSLQQAIDAVCDGGVLVLESGEYEGKIRLVGKAITIRGDEEDPPVIKAAGGGQGVISLLQGADVVLEHLNLIGGEKCVLATVDATVQLKGCQIGQCVVGLELKNRAQATIEHSVFSLADDSGIHAEGMCTLQVYETTFSDCQHAMKIYGETELEVSGCALVGNDRGVAVADASRISVIDTLFEANGTGIDFQDVGSIEISQCRIVGSSDWAIDGTADNVRITDCLIEENEWGISMYFEVDSLEIMGCTICRNRVMGLSLTGGITGVVARCCMQGNGGDGIELGGYEDAPLNIALVETVVENNGHGVRCFHHVIGEMSGCSVTGNSGYGVYVARATELFGENNVIEGNGADVHSLSEETRNYLQPSSSGSGQEGIHLSPSDRTTLREAFAQVQSGGVITLEDGTYETAVLVDKDVSIRAASGATPILTPPMRDMDVFDVVGNARLTLEGVTISGGRIGIATYGTSAFLLNRCTFSDNLLGVWLYEESSGVVTESHFENNRSEGGVICETANAEFRRCSFVNHRSKWGYGKGLSFTDSSGAILDECAFLDNDFGLVFRGGPTVTMKNLLVEDNGKGIVVYGHGCVPPGAVIVEPFAGEITGSGNRIRGNLEMDLCPDLKADIWPEGFLSE